MRAMTWWDHETESAWSQPWGMAIKGPLVGTRLDLIPANIVPWEAWRSEHPDTVILKFSDSVLRYSTESFSSNYVIGVALGEDAKGYPFIGTSSVGVVNDYVGEYPVVITADPDSKSVHTYLRTVLNQTLEFKLNGGNLVDQETGSTWDLARGIAVDGALRGEVLQKVPYMTAFDWAWEDFYPHTKFYGQ